jgi:predicted DNA-binding transcriptional regulator AlpA
MLCPKDKPLYTVKDMQYLLGLSRQTLYLLCKGGALHPIKLKRAVRFLPAEVEKFVRERTQ